MQKHYKVHSITHNSCKNLSNAQYNISVHTSKGMLIKIPCLQEKHSLHSTHTHTHQLTGQTLPVKLIGLGTPLAMDVEPKLKLSSPISPVL